MRESVNYKQESDEHDEFVAHCLRKSANFPEESDGNGQHSLDLALQLIEAFAELAQVCFLISRNGRERTV